MNKIPMISMLSRKRYTMRNLLVDVYVLLILAGAFVGGAWMFLHTLAERLG